MEADFWHGKWERGDIGFHIADVNPLLVKHIDTLQLSPHSRIFLPLCGKTLDIHWLLDAGYRVVGIDLSEVAIRALFSELGITPEVQDLGGLLQFKSTDINMFVGDFFRLSGDILQKVDAIYDRAAMVALPAAMRLDYAAHLRQVTHTADQLLITYEYDQTKVDGPPFSVVADEVLRHYSDSYQLTQLVRQDVAGGMKGKVPASESVWHLCERAGTDLSGE
ncbi:thiopurine S-methyltransferase [Undibacterium sp. SXout7W]|uniref:thiopurine S-methyltransferase n=1 Tax=Undibacterium sp. SXout7W TaxID=3413049 RepID=UPI003BF0D9E4